jgi:hypothetical protein
MDCDLYIKASQNNFSYQYYKLVPRTTAKSIEVPVNKELKPTNSSTVHYIEVSKNKSVTIQSNLEDFTIEPCTKDYVNVECINTQNFRLTYNYYKSY